MRGVMSEFVDRLHQPIGDREGGAKGENRAKNRGVSKESLNSETHDKTVTYREGSGRGSRAESRLNIDDLGTMPIITDFSVPITATYLNMLKQVIIVIRSHHFKMYDNSAIRVIILCNYIFNLFVNLRHKCLSFHAFCIQVLIN